MKYLLPCEKCGEKTAIDVNQAGQPIACCCGAMLEVPSLRGIRELARSDEAVEAVAKRAWSRERGIAFVAGLVIILVTLGLGTIAVLRITSLADIPEPSVHAHKIDGAEIDAMSPLEAWGEWKDLREEGLGPYQPPIHFLAQQSIRRHKVFVAVVSVIAVCALALSAGACLFPSAKRSH
ncbi:MAG: hypothetical protein H8E44_42375 [Planctomycetes bacterium]|nr:hypothetical protein [Planctomycetota bacterium]MBL7041595.1 hypothetical protein [Pirellulaceae bacterium]